MQGMPAVTVNLDVGMNRVPLPPFLSDPMVLKALYDRVLTCKVLAVKSLGAVESSGSTPACESSGRRIFRCETSGVKVQASRRVCVCVCVKVQVLSKRSGEH